MRPKFQEKGQALIVVALAAIVLFGFTALAIDGSRSFEDKRNAQNAADTAALAGALAYSRSQDINTAALARALSNGYDGGDTNDITITVTDSPAGVCPVNVAGKDVRVDIVSRINTSIAKVVGQNTLTNAVTATARSCGFYYGPPFDGNAIVALAPTGKGFDGSGTPDWTITGGGIFSNSSSSNAAYCNGATGISVPSVTVVGGTDFGCHGPGTIGPVTTDAYQYAYSSMSGFFPRRPICDGNAYQSAGKWYPQAGTDGSKVAWSGDMDFTTGLYCVTNSPGPYHGAITGNRVTFYLMPPNFNFKLAGGGSFTASAPTKGEYQGILLYLAPQLDANGNLIQMSGNAKQEIDLRGNGNANVIGTIMAPSADITMFGNSGTGAFNSQIIGYHVDSGGNANIKITYKPNRNYNANLPIMLSLIK